MKKAKKKVVVKKAPVRRAKKPLPKPTPRRSKTMKVGDTVSFHESAKHKAEKATVTAVHKEAGLFNVEVVRDKVKVPFNSVGTAKDRGGAYIEVAGK